MPVVRIEMWAGRSKEQKKKLIEDVTKAVCDCIGCPPEAVHIVINDIPKENWGAGGKQSS
ncbi:MAG: 4-oxalocrotonate tautomerase [Candidatus Altiarchaeota archaeon]|nr:4-oxalocrotonate tautomerase [Candidatus Altiarchaeota archaeon]